MRISKPSKRFLRKTKEQRLQSVEDHIKKIKERDLKKPPRKQRYRPTVNLPPEVARKKFLEQYSNLRGRSITLKFVPISPPLQASNPEELKEAFDDYIEEKTKNQEEN